MTKQKKSLRIIILSLALTNFLFGVYAPTAFAQTQPRKYQGVQDQIKDFLCTPSDASIDPKASQGDLYNCINKIYRFALVIAAVFGVFMLVLAGYIYMAASGNEESVTKAKDILTTTIVSLVILSSGYILLRFLNPDLIKFQPIQPAIIGGKDLWAGVTDAQLAALFSKAGVSVAPSANVSGLSQSVASEITNLGQNCKCNPVITSSTGGTHAAGECSHASGNKVDIRPSASLDAYILKFSRPSPNVRGDGAPLYVSPWGGIYADERTKPPRAASNDWTGAHWDIAVCGS